MTSIARTLIRITLAIGLAATAAGTENAPKTVTVTDSSSKAFGRSLANLPTERFPQMLEGKMVFVHRFLPTGQGPQGLDGLGPLYVADACDACHFKDGRGRRPQDAPAPHPPLVFKLAGSTPLGTQLQDRAVGARPEGRVQVTYREETGHYADGTPYSLRRPSYRLVQTGPGFEAELISARVPPTLVGMGLIEAVPASQPAAWADPDDLDGDGISGRLSQMDDRPGRFGWKAEQATLRDQVVTALAEDMGVDAGTELAPENLDHLLTYLRLLAPPARRDVSRPEVQHGEQLFARIGCAQCHRPSLHTGSQLDDSSPPELASQRIQAYTDLLLHDMGQDLADAGTGTERGEWRTPPLWGLGLLGVVNGETSLLHDGRARTFEEAILWHGGEADASKHRFKALDASDREALLLFLNSL